MTGEKRTLSYQMERPLVWGGCEGPEVGTGSQVRGHTSLGLIGMWGILEAVGSRGCEALELQQVDALGLVHRLGHLMSAGLGSIRM